ncbi:nuclear transport factor 2 family protein [Taklimakanibacter deserti]|uniref:nuclear transport factor 2 family protein n=1 Tax=Taklimakanibacter deserti TaxID=2267839 RepID=UPI000E65BB6C
MSQAEDPTSVVQRQLDAYNAHDMEAWLATYAPDARQYEYPDKLLAEGHDAIRARMTTRFQDPDLHAHLKSRIVLGNTVIDHEHVARTFPEGPGHVEMVAIYQVTAGHIGLATFIIGDKKLS